MLNQIIKKITEQQDKLDASSPAFIVGEQLKEMCEKQPSIRELILQDLDVPEMSIQKAADKLKAYADKNHKSAKCFCITPLVSEKILREFYGLPAREEQVSLSEPVAPNTVHINLEDFFND